MKKYLMGVVALIMAVSLSAYTAPPKKKGKWDLYWFTVKPGFGPSSVFNNEMVDYLTTSGVVPTGICMVWPWTHKCVIGFEFTAFDPATNKLYSGFHMPVAIGEKRPTF